MIQPIYFPFTYIPETTAQVLYRFFGRISVLQPVRHHPPETLRRLADTGIIEIFAPSAAAIDDERLIGCLKDFTEWGRLHHGEEISLKEFFKDGFSRQGFTAQIRTDILKGQAAETSDPDPLFLSRLFLLMAQDLDLQQSEVNRELASTISHEMDLFTRMTGESTSLKSSENSLFRNDFGAYMTGSRISAWCRLMSELPAGSAFLLTTSRSVMEEVFDTVSGLEMIWEKERLSSRQPAAIVEKFLQMVADLTGAPWTGANQISPPDFNTDGDRQVRFSLYILPEAGPADVCQRISKSDYSKMVNNNRQLNTLVGFFESREKNTRILDSNL